MMPNGWESGVIEDIAQVSSGGTPSRKKDSYWVNGTIPWVTTAEVKFNVITDTEQKITEEGLQKSSAKLYPKDTILMAMYGQGKTRGQVAKLGIEASTNQACAALQLNAGFNVDYYYQYLTSQYENIRELANSGGQQNLSGGIVKEIQVPIPPLPEQQKIAKILSTWDKAISTTERLIENSIQQKKALMQQLLTGKKRLLDESGQRFEGEWEEIELGDICSRVMEKNNGQSTNVVTISAQQGLIRQEEFFKKSVASEILDNYYVLRKGQFAYNKSYSNGYPMGAIKRLNRYEDGVVTTLYICFEIKDHSKTDTDFLEQYFDSGLLNRGLTKVAAEGGRAHGLLNVKPSDFMALKFKFPTYPEQQKIATVLTNANKEIELLEQQLADLQQEKKALMQVLLTGKKRVVVDGTF
ncbi:restriction endonuclease subunit S [Psychrobacter sp. NPDC078929]|uniref:restriction endonuclease subunit S n=1 Tax=unclassified Psychrobacter TaxID=196806 RepID=UPI003CFEF494|tara:strand:+ start:500 stop:1732 length:1233 start_codon:yes stop_codon:yes gene_type:complete